MPKSKNRKGHQEKLNFYKANKKREQELFKKKMIEQYTNMQKEMLENQEAHSSVEEVAGPEINVDELNGELIKEFEFEPINLEEVENVEFSDAVIIEEKIEEKPEEIS